MTLEDFSQNQVQSVVDFPVSDRCAIRRTKENSSTTNVLGEQLVDRSTGQPVGREFRHITEEGPVLLGVDENGVYVLNVDTGEESEPYVKVRYDPNTQQLLGIPKWDSEEVVIEHK